MAFSTELYNRLMADRYGNWSEVFDSNTLRALCERMEQEADAYIGQMVEAELAELDNDARGAIDLVRPGHGRCPNCDDYIALLRP